MLKRSDLFNWFPLQADLKGQHQVGWLIVGSVVLSLRRRVAGSLVQQSQSRDELWRSVDGSLVWFSAGGILWHREDNTDNVKYKYVIFR